MADVATVAESSSPTAPGDDLDALPPIPSKQSTERLPAAAEPAQPTELPEEFKKRLDSVIYSDIGITTLLARLKQSVASAKDLAVFLKKRAVLEEEHAQGLRKLSRTIHEAAHRSDNRQGTFSQSYDEIYRIHERLADHGQQFAASLLQMSEDLQEHAATIERGRKQWKQTGLSAEKRAQDAEAIAEKAKHKYDSLAEQYDRVRTGDKQAGVFGLKGPKSAAQHEEDLLRKVQNADSDYAAKVQAAQAARQELISMHRPQAVQNLQQLTAECDAASVLQLQKYATFYEKLLLGQGLCISPLKSDAPNSTAPTDSLREIIARINNSKDFHDFVLNHEGTAVTSEQIQYTRHPALAPSSAAAAPPASQPSTFNNQRTSMTLPLRSSPPASMQTGSQVSPSTATRAPYVPYSGHNARPSSSQGPPQPPYPGSPASDEPYSVQQPSATRNTLSQIPAQAAPVAGGHNFQHLPPLRPVFGVSLDDLYRRDGTAVPLVVYQCLQAVELFGLDTEGIYRLSGSANHINQMKAIFDNDASKVDFTNPENFFHDVNSVAGLLKQFFRDLPEPLFTSQFYADFIAAARIDDDIQRRDSLHALINSLPDAHYATLRALILHLNKVQEHYSQNRMNAGNIAICFGPTLMGANSGGNIADAGWQVRVIETILVNTFQIFDDD